MDMPSPGRNLGGFVNNARSGLGDKLAKFERGSVQFLNG